MNLAPSFSILTLLLLFLSALNGENLLKFILHSSISGTISLTFPLYLVFLKVYFTLHLLPFTLQSHWDLHSVSTILQKLMRKDRELFILLKLCLVAE